MSFLPGMFPAGAIVSGPQYTPASMVFNGTDETLRRTLSTSGASTTIFTYSLWFKLNEHGEISDDLFTVIDVPGGEIYLNAATQFFGEHDDLAAVGHYNNSNELFYEDAFTTNLHDGWHHFVFRYDSTQGTAADRIRLYIDGSLLAPDIVNDPSLNEPHILFTNGYTHIIGGFDGLGSLGGIVSLYNGKIAFIDVLDGVSADPTAFAFDNNGTWTRKKYTGSYGTHGFSIDGSTGVLGEDVSGNGQHFTGVNMDDSNLDPVDLPPWTN